MKATLYKYKITEVTLETEDTRSYTLVPLQENIPYKAGQFISFQFTIHGKTLRRPYSIASAPSVDPYIKILVKRIPNGAVSRYIHEHWSVDTEVEALEPAGKFTLDNSIQEPRDIFLVAAGSGISPIMSILKEALYTMPKSHIKLFYSNRNISQTIFLKELNQLLLDFPERLTIEHLHSESQFLQKARLNRFLLEELVHKNMKYGLTEALFYTCGPYDYMQLCEIVARYLGFDKANIKKEIYTVPEDEGDDDAETSKVFSLDDRSPKEVEIHWKGQQYRIQVAFPQSILEVALENNIELPYSCRAGQCSSCATTCTSGKVVMSYNAVLTEKDEKNGLVLTCKGHPTTDKVVLDYDL